MIGAFFFFQWVCTSRDRDWLLGLDISESAILMDQLDVYPTIFSLQSAGMTAAEKALQNGTDVILC